MRIFRFDMPFGDDNYSVTVSEEAGERHVYEARRYVPGTCYNTEPVRDLPAGFETAAIDESYD